MVDGLTVLSAWITEEDERAALDEIDAQTWSTSLRRRVQQYGVPYSYRRRTIDEGRHPDPPPVITALARSLEQHGILEQRAEQVIVNEYLPGQGIAPHVDHPRFGPVVASISLGSATVMTFTREDIRHETVLRPRSLMVLRDGARQQWRHGIAARRTDAIDGERIARARRVSITFRTLA